MNIDTTWNEKERPTLETPRLILRPFIASDAKDVQRMAGHALIAATTANIPHPYPDGAAEEWIGLHKTWFEQKKSTPLAITLKSSKELIGCIDLFGYSPVHAKAELGYWIGVDYWNQGYGTEAATAMIKYGFEKMYLNKISARYVDTNQASGKIMMKAGMAHEGLLKQDVFKNGEFHNVVVYGILKSDWEENRIH